MSAFLCTHTHINSIVAFVADQVQLRRTSWEYFKVDGPQQLAEQLYAENVRSFTHRYQGADAQQEAREYGRIFYRQPRKTLTPIEVIKAAHCLEYQSCEHDEWEGSQARAALQTIISQAAAELPDYDAAPWAIYDDPQPEPEPNDGDARIILF